MPTKDIATYPQRRSLELVRADLAVLLPMTIADGFSVGFGDVLGAIDANGFGRRRTRSLVDTQAFATNSNSGRVADASLFRDGDVLKSSAGTTIGTVAVGGINKTTNVITLTANAAVAVPIGDAVLGSDGSQVARAISDAASDGVGNTPLDVMIAGFVKESAVKGLDATAKAELRGATTINGVFKF